MFGIFFGEEFVASLQELKASKRREILDKIQEQLSHRSTEETRNKKILEGFQPPWKQRESIWELRIGEYRVFYDVDPDENRVMVHALRHKPPHKTTEEIL
jgi:mRNA-degrading endonuclease RelE of RelBE toxin-antitoxin system